MSRNNKAKPHIERYDPDKSQGRSKSKTDWSRVDAMTDDEIDYSDSPELDDDFIKNMRRVYPSKATPRNESNSQTSTRRTDWAKVNRTPPAAEGYNEVPEKG